MKIVRESLNIFKIQNIKKEDISIIVDMCSKIFSDVMPYEENVKYINYVTDFSISKKATLNGKIIGCYLFNKQSIFESEDLDNLPEQQTEDLSKYENKKPLQGVALALLPEYRGLSYGRQLRDIPLSMKDYDYIWGVHLKGLHNINNWLKYGRRIVAETDEVYATLMDLKPINESFDNFHRFQENDYVCGTTCVQMVSDYLNIPYKDFQELIELCQTTSLSGTTDIGIKNALDKLNINYKQNILNKDESIQMLNSELSKNNLFIMRTLTKGIKHWIIIYGKEGNQYLVADPWLGLIKYSLRDLLNIWQPRNFDGFTIYV